MKSPKHATQFQRYILGVSWNEAAMAEIRKRLNHPKFGM